MIWFYQTTEPAPETALEELRALPNIDLVGYSLSRNLAVGVDVNDVRVTSGDDSDIVAILKPWLRYNPRWSDPVS